MAIETDDAVEKFGTRQALQDAGASVTSGSFAQALTNDLVAVDDVVYGSIDFVGNFASAPTAGTTIDIFLRPMSFGGVKDGTVPSADFPVIYVGSIPLNSGAVNTETVIDIGLPNNEPSQVYELFIRNNGGQTLQVGWFLGFTPKAIGPKA